MSAATPVQTWFGYLVVSLALTGLILWANPAVALLVGAAITLTWNRAPVEGGNVIGKYLLQTAIVLLGLKLNITDLWRTSADYAGLIALYVIAALAIGLGLGRLLRVERTPATLIAAGTAICGGTTIATLAPILRASPGQMGLTLAIVFLLNAVALMTFPSVGAWLQLSQTEFGLWSALAIHDTSSVVATAAIYGEEAAEVATTLKLGRTLWLIPLVLGVSLMNSSHDAKLRVPGFILVFIGASAIGSLIGLPEFVVTVASVGSKWLLIGALFFVGTEITRTTVGQIRGRVVWHALLLWSLVIPATLFAARAFA